MARGNPTSSNSPLPVSPQGLHTMYQSTRTEHTSFKADMNRLLVRLINAFGRIEIQSCVLADPPLMNIHEIFLQAEQRVANIRSPQDMVIISEDSSLQPANSFGSVSGGSISDGAWLSDHQPGRTSDNEPARATDNEPARALDNF
ncbi:hypothetical protein ACFE04_003451 [Oxalis oulophora]